MHPAEGRPKLMDPVPPIVGFGPTQLMPQVLETFQACQAFRLGLGRKAVVPLEQWH